MKLVIIIFPVISHSNKGMSTPTILILTCCFFKHGYKFFDRKGYLHIGSEQLEVAGAPEHWALTIPSPFRACAKDIADLLIITWASPPGSHCYFLYYHFLVVMKSLDH